MKKTLVKSEKEYREYVFKTLEERAVKEDVLENTFGVIKEHSCWDYDENGNEIDEDGNIIPDDFSSPELLVFEDWVKQMSFPLIIISWIETSFDRHGDVAICVAGFVELKEFQ